MNPAQKERVYNRLARSKSTESARPLGQLHYKRPLYPDPLITGWQLADGKYP